MEPRRRRWAIVATAAVLAAGGVTAGASALTGSIDEPARQAKPAAKQRPNVSYTADGVPYVRAGPECKAGASGRHHGERKRSKGTVKY
jgi:hypothetical protein